MALFRDLIFWIFFTEFFEFFLIFLGNLKGILRFFLGFILLTWFSSPYDIQIFGAAIDGRPVGRPIGRPVGRPDGRPDGRPNGSPTG